MEDAPLLVGRGREVGAVQDALRTGRSVILTGPAGVGKTVLARRAGRDVLGPCLVLSPSAATAPIALGVLAHRLGPTGVSSSTSLGAAIGFLAGHAVVVVDDGDQLDHVTAAAVRLAHEDRGIPVVVTVRDDRALPADLERLRRAPATLTLAVGGLDVAATAALAGARLGGRVDGYTARQLHERTAGNPLHVRELLDDGLRTGALRAADGVWTWRGPTRPGASLRALVGDRLVGLDPAARDALEVVAFAEPIELDVALRSTDAAALSELEANGVVIVDHEPPVVRTAHPLYGDIVRADLGRLRERELAARLLAATPVAADPYARIRRADLAWRAGAADAEVLTDGAFAALGVFDFDRAHALASEALRLDAVSATGLADHGGTRLVRAATVLAAIGRYDDAVGLFDAQPTDTTDVRWAVQRATTLFMRDRHGDRARDALRASPVSDRHNELAATQAWIELFDGALPAAAAAANAVFDDPASSPTALVWAAIAGAAAGALGADTSTGPAMLLTARASLERVRDDSPFAPLQVDLADWLVRLTTLDVADAVSTAERHYADAVESGSPIRVGAWAGFAGWAALESGQLALAEGRLLESSALTAAVDPFGLTAFADAVLAAVHALRGNVEDAAERLARLDASPPLPGLLVGLADRYRAWTEAAAGDIGRAETLLRRAAGHGRQRDQLFVEVLAHLDLARLCARPLAAVDQRRLTAAARDHLGARRALRAIAVFDGGTEDTALLDELRRLGAAVVAGDLAVAGRSPDLTAVDDDILAVRTPLRLRARGQGSALTTRELEIALLAAQRLSSRAIADRCGVSVRTVDNHLGRIYAKLGVADRAALADLYRR